MRDLLSLKSPNRYLRLTANEKSLDIGKPPIILPSSPSSIRLTWKRSIPLYPQISPFAHLLTIALVFFRFIHDSLRFSSLFHPRARWNLRENFVPCWILVRDEWQICLNRCLNRILIYLIINWILCNLELYWILRVCLRMGLKLWKRNLET